MIKDDPKTMALTSAKLDGLLRIAGEAIVIADAKFRVIEFSHGAELLFGYAHAEIIGKSLDRLLPARFSARHHEFMAAFAKESAPARLMSSRGRVVGLKKSGEEFLADASISHSRTGDEIIFTAILRDVTERMREDERLRRAKRQAEDAAEAKSAFLAIMSHELRTPLNAIIGFAEFIRLRVLDQDMASYDSYLDDIIRSGRHLAEIIDDVLDQARMEHGQMELDESVFDPAAAIAEAVRTSSALAQAREIKIDIRRPDPCPPLRADRRRFVQIAINLLSNAVKFSDSGKNILVDLTADAESGLVMKIVDQGIGIPADKLDSVFEMFTQASNHMRRREGGVGLGLSIVKAICEAHGGSINLASAIGEGTVITVCLPARRIVRA